MTNGYLDLAMTCILIARFSLQETKQINPTLLEEANRLVKAMYEAESSQDPEVSRVFLNLIKESAHFGKELPLFQQRDDALDVLLMAAYKQLSAAQSVLKAIKMNESD